MLVKGSLYNLPVYRERKHASEIILIGMDSVRLAKALTGY